MNAKGILKEEYIKKVQGAYNSTTNPNKVEIIPGKVLLEKATQVKPK